AWWGGGARTARGRGGVADGRASRMWSGGRGSRWGPPPRRREWASMVAPPEPAGPPPITATSGTCVTLMPGGIKESAAPSVNCVHASRDQRGRVTCVTLPPSNDTVKVCDGLASYVHVEASSDGVRSAGGQRAAR